MGQQVQDAPEVKVERPQDDAQAYIDLEGQGAEQPQEPAPQEQEAVSGETVQQPSEQPPEQEDWEHKYRVLKGKYDKEVPRLHKEIKQLRREKEELYRRLELLERVVSMQKQQSETPQAPQVEEEDEEIKKFKEDYPEIYRAIERILQKKVLSKVEKELGDLSKNVTEQQFYAQLTSLVPEWRELNTDPDFLAWLQEEEGDTGLTRHQLMLSAYEQGNAPAVAKFFKRYLAQQRNNDSEPVEKKPAPATKNVAPPHRKTSSSVREGAKKIFKESEINEFYRLCALGKISPEQREKMEKEIIDALVEGRVLLGK